MKQDIRTLIQSGNTHKLVKIRLNKDWVYLEYTCKKSRKKYYPHIQLSLNAKDFVSDYNKLRLAWLIRDEQEEVIASGGRFGDRKRELTFRDFANTVLKEKRSKNRLSYLNAINRFNSLFPDIGLSQIADLEANDMVKAIDDLSNNTFNHYIKYMRHILNEAERRGYIQKNPFLLIKLRHVSVKKDFLIREELERIALVDCDRTQDIVRRAFLFSCYTGLRLGDIYRLRPDNIKNGVLTLTLGKTKTPLTLPLPNIALKLPFTGQGKSFPLPGYKTLRTALNGVLNASGIDKHITFHCARHTFATLLITQGVDIYTVSQLLGHGSVSTTQIYAKLVDEKRREAMMKLDQ